MDPTWTMNMALTERVRACAAERSAPGISTYVHDLVGRDQAEQRSLRLRAMVNDGRKRCCSMQECRP
ncbi:MAG: hypothetical protein J0L57_07600 [Burkholderiales bacterium]|nr:hypothetical protein [Burkholderiales bacterium]